MWCFVLHSVLSFFVFKQKTADEMRISDWSSDVCSSDLGIDGTMITAWRGEQATTRRIAHVQSRGPCRLAGRKRKAPAASVAPGEGVAWLRTAGPVRRDDPQCFENRRRRQGAA